jgi:hypothetical protein
MGTADPEFLVEAETLLAKTEECLSHLQLISNDKDAIDCMLSTLLKLANKADALALAAVSEFSLHIHGLLNHAQNHMDLHDEALSAERLPDTDGLATRTHRPENRPAQP